MQPFHYRTDAFAASTSKTKISLWKRDWMALDHLLEGRKQFHLYLEMSNLFLKTLMLILQRNVEFALKYLDLMS